MQTASNDNRMTPGQKLEMVRLLATMAREYHTYVLRIGDSVHCWPESALKALRILFPNGVDAP